MAATDGIDALVRAVRQRIEQEGLRPFASRTGIPIGQLRSVLAGRASRYTTLQSIAAVMGMRLFVGSVERNGPEASVGAGAPSKPTVTTSELKISHEPLAERVLRQARSGTLDEARLLPSDEKRTRDVGKKLDQLAARQGWYTFMAGQAYAVAAGKAPAKRNAEIMAVEQVLRWRAEVSRFAPDRLAEFDKLVADALNNPVPVQHSDR